MDIDQRPKAHREVDDRLDPFARDEPAVIARLMERVVSDRSSGIRRSTADYLSLFPGYERTVERELAALLDEGNELWNIGGYRILEELGRGGQGVVYLAEDPVLPRRVALKVLRDLTDAKPGLFLRLRREAELMASIDHPGVCPIFAVGLDGAAPWVAMRFIDGEPLTRGLARDREAHVAPEDRNAIEGRVRTMVRIARAVAAVHAAGVVHRDLKPGNVMITASSGEPVVLDFGLASTSDSTLTLEGDLMGSPAYMSPEQVRGEPTDARADVWGLGVVLFELLTLRRPFEHASSTATLAAIDRHNPPTVRSVNPHVPKDVAVIVATALERDIERRYLNAGALADDLEAWLEHRPIAARPAGLLLRFTRLCQRHPVRAIAALALVLLIAAGTVAVGNAREASRLATEQGTEVATHQLENAYAELMAGNGSLAQRALLEAKDALSDTAEYALAEALCLVSVGRPDAALASVDRALADGGDAALGAIRRFVADGVVDTSTPAQDATDAFVRGVLGVQRARGTAADASGYSAPLELLQTAAQAAPRFPALCTLQVLHAAGRAGRDDIARAASRGVGLAWPKSPAVALLALGDAEAALALDPSFVLALHERADDLDGAGDGVAAAALRSKAADIESDATTRTARIEADWDALLRTSSNATEN